MGKNLKGKELGTGISQRKGGRYSARFTTKSGKRVQKYFDKLQECRNWLADAQFNDEHGSILNGEYMTVDAWFDYWLENIKKNNIKYNTIELYKNRYKANIKPIIGKMLLSDVKPLHCQNVLNQMRKKYANSSIDLTRITMHTIFESAVDNELILNNPVKKRVVCKSGKKSKSKRVLTIEEQKEFVCAALESRYYNQFALVLQTGLRASELIGLKWSDIDFEKKILSVKRKLIFKEKSWQSETPKSESSIREIPLTDEAIKILKMQKEKNKEIKVIPIEFADIVFLSKKGIPITDSNYNTLLYKISDEIGIEKISMHSLRHTFATRCIEGGMKPKTLQKLLGHSNIGVTMDIYVHITDEEKKKEVMNVEKLLKVV